MIIQGDCREVMARFDDASFDCIIADPPYGETSLEWDQWPGGWPAIARRVLKPTGSMWVFGSFRMFMRHWADFSDWRHTQEIVWEKHNGTNMANDRFRRVHELVVQFIPAQSRWTDIFKAPQFTNDATARAVQAKTRPLQWGKITRVPYVSQDGGPRLMRSVLQVRSEHGRAIHPTQKPIGIVEPILRFSCPVGGRVLDPFGGSGTTAIVAKECGMDATLIEGVQEFCDLAATRIAADAPLLAASA